MGTCNDDRPVTDPLPVDIWHEKAASRAPQLLAESCGTRCALAERKVAASLQAWTRYNRKVSVESDELAKELAVPLGAQQTTHVEQNPVPISARSWLRGGHERDYRPSSVDDHTSSSLYRPLCLAQVLHQCFTLCHSKPISRAPTEG